MSGVPYVGSPVYPASITEPKDGEPCTVASINVAVEGNRDAVVYLKAQRDVIDGTALRNWHVPFIKADGTGTALDFSHARGDGTNTAFWSTTYNLWIKCGSNTAGKFYIGDAGWFSLFDTAAAAPPKVSFGCDSAIGINPGRVCVFNGDTKTSGGGVDPKYILGPAAGDYAVGTWTTKSLDAIGSFTSYVKAYDCVVTPTQRIIVVGGGDNGGVNHYLAWKSDDHGNSFTRVTVGTASAVFDALTRVIVGKNGRLVAWIKAATALQGNKLWYSDDNGNTWSSRSGIGFDNIVDGVYLPDLDVWAFSAAGPAIYTVADPAVSAFTANAISFVPTAMTGFGHSLIYAQQTSAFQFEMFLSRDAMATDLTLVGRDPLQYNCVNLAVSPYHQVFRSAWDGASAASIMFSGRE
jgi:hypothetical protein